MNLSNNLITLRKKANISQEELAEKLDVSRQAISKWESGNGYPETEKLLKLCEIFNCSMDTLMKGKIEEKNNNSDLNEYDKFMSSFAKYISIGVFLVLVGVTLLLFYLSSAPSIENMNEKDIMIGVSILLLFVLISVPIFIIKGLKMEAFKKKYSNITNNYTNEEIEKFDKKFAVAIAALISFILLGVILLVLMYGLKTYKNELMPVSLFMIFITIASPLLTYFGILKSKYDLDTYNKVNRKIEMKEAILIGISAVIMIITTIIYFILSFVFNLWKYSWILYPIGGMICGIVSIILYKED